MYRKTCNTSGKIIGIFLFSLIISLPVPAYASPKSLVLFPLAIYADQSKAYIGQGIKRMLISRISGAGIEIVPDEKYASLLSEKEDAGITSQKRAEELARVLKADYAIFGSITTIGGGYSLDLSLVALEKDESKLTRISKAVDEDQLIPQLSDVAYQLRALIEGKEMPARKIAEKAVVLPKPRTAKGIFSPIGSDKKEPQATEKGLVFKPTKEYQGFKPTGRISVGMSVMAFDMGDLDGKAGVELLVVGRKKLLLYARQGATFVVKDTLKAGFGEDFLKVSAGDTDNDGMAEIYLVSRYGIRARSAVLKWDGTFKRLDRRAGHMQAVKDPASGKALLLFQDSRVDELFSGRIYGMKYGEGGKLIKGEKLPELEGVQFYTLALFDTDK
ncbi:MAG TPA: VCBS repeat-containing protein, partial [Desulfobacteraceae bacterium]|nr:VCBS repeat-containing protein [Desulfobacteraceae bacterium]